ncbi:glucose dehydrogenase [Sesbania bispinosa]|nr:glucose dehydrogenase [Sesbania bispinosa]
MEFSSENVEEGFVNENDEGSGKFFVEDEGGGVYVVDDNFVEECQAGYAAGCDMCSDKDSGGAFFSYDENGRTLFVGPEWEDNNTEAL